MLGNVRKKKWLGGVLRDKEEKAHYASRRVEDEREKRVRNPASSFLQTHPSLGDQRVVWRACKWVAAGIRAWGGQEL